MHFATLPDARAQLTPEASCLADERLSLTNADFAARVRGAAESFAERGVRPGDIVAVMLPNRIELVATLFAAWRLGAAVTPINPSLTHDEAQYQFVDSCAKLLVSDNQTLPVQTITPDALPTDGTAESEPHDDPHALALVIYTSGTTGRPKGVLLDHANLDAMCAMSSGTSGLSADDHSLLILPLFHVNGIVVSILAPLRAGARATIAGRFDPETFFGIVQRVRPTYFSGVPAIYAMLLARPETETPDLSSVRFALCGAAPMPPHLITEFQRRFGVPVVEGYGLSEGTCASTLNPVGGPRKPGTVGVPFDGQEVAIMDDSGRLLPPDEVGEVVVRGPNVMRGYLNRPEETAKTIVDGWLHTGDVGRFDEDGYLVLVDRIKDMIIRGGENIYPSEIEAVLHRNPAVAEAAVVGATHQVLGEVPVAFVSLRSEANPEELLAFCGESLSKYKLPTEIRVVERLPRNPVGKIDKPALRAHLLA
jgi:long-chain acyl-CoA synthetase